MKRRIIHIVVLLVLGAIVNIAVAWGFVAFLGFEPLKSTWTNNRDEIRWPRGITFRPTGELHFNQETGIGVGRQYHYVDASTLPLNNRLCWVGTRHDTGWPVLSISSITYASGALNSNGQLDKTDSSEFESGITIGAGRRLPLFPIWPGFAINTIFYAAILGVLFFIPGKVRRAMRRRRGLCPSCAYPVGTSEVCTECGAKLPNAQPRRGDGL